MFCRITTGRGLFPPLAGPDPLARVQHLAELVHQVLDVDLEHFDEVLWHDARPDTKEGEGGGERGAGEGLVKMLQLEGEHFGDRWTTSGRGNL